MYSVWDSFPSSLIRCGIDVESAVLGQIAADRARFWCQRAIHDRKIVLFGLLPMLLQNLFGRFALGEDQDAGSLAVQAMNDVNPVSGTGVPLADIIVEDGMGRSRFVPLSPHRQQSARLFHDDDILVFVQERNSFGLIFCWGTFSCLHGILSLKFFVFQVAWGMQLH